MNSAEIEAMKGAVVMRLEEQGEFKRLEEQMQSLNSKIQTLEQKTKTVMRKTGVRIDDFLVSSGIAFSASMTKHNLLKADEPLIFDDVLLNLGNGYNPLTGEFVAPIDGRYLFSLTVRAEYRKQVSADILAGTVVLARVTSGNCSIDRDSAAVTVVMEMKANDAVNAQQANAKTGAYHGNGFTAFCGVLLD